MAILVAHFHERLRRGFGKLVMSARKFSIFSHHNENLLKITEGFYGGEVLNEAQFVWHLSRFREINTRVMTANIPWS